MCKPYHIPDNHSNEPKEMINTVACTEKIFLDKLTRRAFVSGFLSVLPGKLVDADFGEINPESFELVSPFVLTEIIYE